MTDHKLVLSVLITVYHRIDPDELTAALDSLVTQTRMPDDILVVIDGPIPPTLRARIDDFAAAHPIVRVHALPNNLGAGPASQAGIELINADVIARLDADDIACPTRFEKQLAAIEDGFDVVGTAMEEFATDPESPTGVRRLPETHEAIARYARINSPVNNPSVMIRRAALLAAGGYRDVHFMEDYDLYARLLSSGARFVNLPEPLTKFRVTDSQFGRRTGREMLAAEWQMQKNLVSYGLVSRPRSVVNYVVRTAYRFLPLQLLQRVYRLLFHRNTTHAG